MDGVKAEYNFQLKALLDKGIRFLAINRCFQCVITVWSGFEII